MPLTPCEGSDLLQDKLIFPPLAEHSTIQSKSVMHQTLHLGHGAFFRVILRTERLTA